MNRPQIPPIGHDDRLPHDKAVWLEQHMPTDQDIKRGAPVTIDRGGFYEQTHADAVDWADVRRWRFGWAPAKGAAS